MVNSDGGRDERVPELEMEGSRGVLTEDDRELLADPSKREGLSAPALSQRWKKIRERVKNSIMDYLWLVYCLPKKQRRRIFESEQLNDPNDPEWEERVFSYLIAFAHQHFDNPQRLERAVSTGIRRAEIEKGTVADVDVEITVQPQTTVQEVMERFSQGGVENITYAEINMLYHAGELTSEERLTLELEKRPVNLSKKQGEVYMQDLQQQVDGAIEHTDPPE